MTEPRWMRAREVSVPGLYLWVHPGELLGNASKVWVARGRSGQMITSDPRERVECRLVCPMNRKAWLYGPIPDFPGAA